MYDYQKVATLYLEDFIQQSEDGQLFTISSAVKISEENTTGMIEMFKQHQGVLALDRQQMNQSFLGTLKDNFNQLILYSFIAVFLILLFAFKNLKITLITLIPIAVTWVIALFFMVMLNIQFNVLNIIISTFIFGLGIDYSIFITTGLNQEFKFKNNVLKTYKTSILLSVITTLLGMGVLIFAQHPALKSIAGVSVIGIFSAVLVSFTIQPYLFRLMFKENHE
jgi:predicted RND superfamily exporter protein